MCTSIVVNKKKTIVGWNLDIMDFEYRIRPTDDGVFIEINDATEGWMPLFGANRRGDFVGMPTCWPHDERSNPAGGDTNVIMLNIDLLMMKKTLQQVRDFVQDNRVCSVPELTFMSSLSDSNGNVLHIVPGLGFKYYEKPDYKIMTNFPPFVPNPLQHPWMGLDRYRKAESLLGAVTNDFDVDNCFQVLNEVSQTVCPTVISMVLMSPIKPSIGATTAIMVKLRLKDSNWMSRLPNILSLFRIVWAAALLCDVVGTTFQKKTKKTLDSSLGA